MFVLIPRPKSRPLLPFSFTNAGNYFRQFPVNRADYVNGISNMGQLCLGTQLEMTRICKLICIFQHRRLFFQRISRETSATVHVLCRLWTQRPDSGRVLWIHLLHSQRSRACNIRSEAFTAAFARIARTAQVRLGIGDHRWDVPYSLVAISGMCMFNSGGCSNYFSCDSEWII